MSASSKAHGSSLPTGSTGDDTPYSFRHKLPRRLSAMGVPRDQIARFLGHGKRTTIDRYAPYEPAYLREAADAIDASFQEFDRLAHRLLLAPAKNRP